MKTKKLSAFTFVELLIAIVIFAVGVLAVMELVIRNLQFTDEIKTQTVATTLAKESMELAFQHKTSNKARGLNWNCVPDYEAVEDDLCHGRLGSGGNNILHIAIDPQGTVYTTFSYEYDNFLDNFDLHQLSYFSGNIDSKLIHRYGYSDQEVDGFDQEESIYARYIKVKKLRENDYMLPSNEVLKIESHVLYKKGSTTGEVVLDSIIGDY